MMRKNEDTRDLERSNIYELRRRLKDMMTPELYNDDNVFERFLRARNQNLDAAETMIKNHLTWRKVHEVDTIVNDYEPSEVLIEYNGMTRIGFDKEGDPVIYVAFGNLDCRGLHKCVTVDECIIFLVAKFEENTAAMKAQSEKIGKPVTQWNMIFDYENFQVGNAMYKPTIEYIIRMMKMYEANYPERLKAAFLINGSQVFHILYNMCRPFLTGTTVQKIKICGKDFREDLLQIMDSEDLPAFLGGTRTDPDGNPKCLQSIKFGGEIPESYYAKNRKLSIIPDAKLLIVGRMSRDTVEVEVENPGSSIQWRFTVDSKDIDFAVFYKKSRDGEEEEAKEVVPKQRIATTLSCESGTCNCEKAGIYVFEFDNMHSRFISKTIYYTITVLEPDS